MLAAFLSIPIALVAQDSYEGLFLLPALQLAGTIALRWAVGPIAWLSLLALGAAVWLIGAASPLLFQWSAAFFVVFLVGFCAGLAALIWRRPTAVRPRPAAAAERAAAHRVRAMMNRAVP